ncbi:MAG: type II toxin-antitoxin system RelE/ParE family toxin [Candidatus Njordarchaeota archaeon]
MTFQIILTKMAIKDLKNLPKTIQLRIISKLNEMKQNPFKNARKLIDPRIGNYRTRAGDYRIIFDVDDNRVVILRIGHRKHIYK